MGIEQKVGGRIDSYKGVQFVKIEKSLDHLSPNPVIDYISTNAHRLADHDLLESRFPCMKGRSSHGLKFFDTETMGLDLAAPIVCAAYTYVNGTIKTVALFPRNFAEERGVLGAFFKDTPGDQGYFAYNAPFDTVRLSTRARSMGVQVNGTPLESFQDHMQGRCVDLYREVVPRQFGHKMPKGPGRFKLTRVEKILFGHTREGDIPGSRIPRAYQDFVYGRGSEDDVAGIIEHCMQDTVTLVAIALKAALEKRRK